MELKFVTTKNEIKQFIGLGKEIYQGNPYYRDSMSEILKLFLDHKTCYLKNGSFFPFIVQDQHQNKILLRAAYMINRKMPDTLMIAFFEAAKGVPEAVSIMLEEGRKIAALHQCTSIVIGLDGHINYGLGFLASHFDVTPCFGFPYSPEYYLDYFRGLKAYQFTSFLTDLSQFNLKKEETILRRLQRHQYTFRCADFNQFDRELRIYTDLNNDAFQDHLWWADRSYEEDYELLYPFRRFIRGENLLIAEKAGIPIGFMLWYPDFNQLIPPGKGLGLQALVRNKLGGRQKIDRLKIAEIGIKPEYQGTGAVLGLFALLYQLVGGRYRYCEAGWVEENNLKSKGLGMHWEQVGCQEYKKYKAYQMML